MKLKINHQQLYILIVCGDVPVEGENLLQALFSFIITMISQGRLLRI